MFGRLNMCFLIMCGLLCMPAGLVFAVKTGSDNPIEIIQLGISEEVAGSVEIIYRLDTDIEEGSVQIERYNQSQGIWDRVEISIGDLIPWEDDEQYFIFVDGDLSNITPPYIYYLAYDDGDGARHFTNIHSTILLKEAVFDFCRGEVTLTWSEYRIWTHGHWPDGPPESLPFGHYQVIIDGEYKGSVPVGQASHVIELEHPGPHAFRIKAVENDDPESPGRYSWSGTLEKEISWAELDTLHLESVDVTDQTSVMLKVKAEGDFQDYVYRFERSREPDDHFMAVLGEVHNPDHSFFDFIDEEADGLNEGIWYYRVKAHLTDNGVVCEDASVYSEAVSTIWLTVRPDVQTESELVLEVRFDQDPLVDGYTLEQWLPGGEDYDIARVNLSPGMFYHDLSGELPLSGDLYFRILGDTDPGPISSNVVVLHIEPQVNIPNAFRPRSEHPENRVFQPRFVGFDPDYTMVIYDRNGLRVFASDSSMHDAAWDGTIDGQPAPAGSYIYHIHYTSDIPGAEGGEKRGVVYLVR